jgi:LmbE family N-acetylglucosaminyl deacetylase
LKYLSVDKMNLKKILIISPHTDDAELGAGGSIAKFLEKGNDVYWVVFSTAEESLPPDLPKDTLKNEFLNVIEDLGIKHDRIELLNYKVRYLNNYRQEILEKLYEIKKIFGPNLVITPSLHDFHQDHQIVANETIRAFKTSASIINYEMPWNQTTFSTNLFIKLKSKHIEKKLNLLGNYKSQLEKKREYFTKEYIFGLAKVRGVQCNSKYAEAFEVIRWMI